MQIATTTQQFTDLAHLMHVVDLITATPADVPTFCSVLNETGARKGEEFFVYSVGAVRMAIHDDNKPKLEVDFKYTTTEDARVLNATLHMLIVNGETVTSISGMY